MNRLVFALLLVFTATVLYAEPAVDGTEIISSYQTAVSRQQDVMKDMSMDVTMEASIPRLKKAGRLNALRHISTLGRITYKVLGFAGDDTVKKEVMARYMTAEVDSADKKSDEIAITPANYNFKYKGLNEKSGVPVHVFELKPKAKRVGLFKGELWVDPSTFLPVQETGRFVKSPSMFIKKVEFTRSYEIRDGVAYLVSMKSKTDTRIVGQAELTIEYGNYKKVEPVIEEARR